VRKISLYQLVEGLDGSQSPFEYARKGVLISCPVGIRFKVTEQRSGLLTDLGLFRVFF
jgi:hypothetical protein